MLTVWVAYTPTRYPGHRSVASDSLPTYIPRFDVLNLYLIKSCPSLNPRERTRPAVKLLLLLKTHIAAIGVCAAALALALVFTTGMAPSFDSLRYANVAQWITNGEGIATSLTVVPVQEGTPAVGDGLHAFTIQPPGLPLFYAATGVDNRETAHRILHIVSLMALAWLVLALGLKISGRTEVGVAAALLTILSPAVWQTAANFWTDLPTIALLLGALYLVTRSHEQNTRAWVWLAGASILAAVAVSFRLTALAFGAVLLTDMLLSRRLNWREQAIRAAAGAGIFGATALAIMVRNKMLAGSWSGTVLHASPLMPEYSLSRGWAFLGSRIMQSFTPGWAVDSVTQKLATANAEPGGWALPGLTFILLGAALAALYYLRRDRNRRLVNKAGWLALALFSATMIVLLIPAGRHAEFGVVEFRYTVSLLPLLWIGIMSALISNERPLVGWILAGILAVGFAAGAPGRHQPYNHSHEFMRTGLNWVKLSIPPETNILTNGGKILLDEDLTRRVWHISDWNFRHALGPQMRQEAGFLQYLQQNDIRYVVLMGKPNRRMANYWGKPIIGLFLEARWQQWLAYSDKHLKVYRIPAAGPPPAQP